MMRGIRRRILTAILILIPAFMFAACSGGGSAPASGIIVNSGVSGTVMYEDLIYNSSGMSTVGVMKPVRYAEVEVVSYPGGLVVATALTNASGAYTIDFSAAEGAGVYVRALASTGMAGKPEVMVQTDLGGLYAYAGAVYAVSTTATQEDFNIAASGLVGGAFNILDVLTAAGEFIEAREGALPLPLVARWQQGSSNDGTAYSSNYGIIYVGGDQYDPDEFDDDVLWHEYGHFAADKLSVDDSPGGAHSGGDTDQDIRLSWSEGWATYFQAMLKEWLLVANAGLSGVLSFDSADGTGATHYVDTAMGFSGSETSIYQDIAVAGAPDYIYSTNEVAVAAVLLGFDALSGPRAVWEVFTTDMPQSVYYASLETFWDGWVGSPGDSPEAQAILTARDIYYMEDPYESDDMASTASPIFTNGIWDSQDRTLYKSDLSDDVDVISFTVPTSGIYVIETFCMRNAADTVIALYDSSGALIDQNDDEPKLPLCSANAYTSNASRIALSLSADTYYIEVTSFPPSHRYPPVSGRYGTYSIMVW